MAQRLYRATLDALDACRPTGGQLRHHFQTALATASSLLSNAIAAWEGHTTPPVEVRQSLVGALDQSVGLSSPALWVFFARHHAAGTAGVRALLERHDLPAHLLRAPSSPPRAHAPRIRIHLCWPRDDAACRTVVDALTELMVTLGDGVRALGEGPDVVHQPFDRWPPADPESGPAIGRLVVLLGTIECLRQLDLSTAWGRRLTDDPYCRTMMAVRVEAAQVHRGTPTDNQDWRTVVWSEAPPPMDDPDDIPTSIGSASDVLTAALWMLVETLAVRPPGQTPDQSIRLPITIDHTAEAQETDPPEHVRVRRAMFRRHERPLEAHPGPPPSILDPAAHRHPVSFDVALMDDTSSAAGEPSVRPRVLVGHTTTSMADTDLLGPGRLTVRAAAHRPGQILLAAQLVAARQAWLEWTIRRHLDAHPNHRALPSPHALALLHSARYDPRPVLVPEPTPAPEALETLRIRGLQLAVRTDTSARGFVLEGWTLWVVCSSSPRPGMADRVPVVLRQVFERAGGVVHHWTSRAAPPPLPDGEDHRFAYVFAGPTPEDPAWRAFRVALGHAPRSAAYRFGMSAGWGTRPPPEGAAPHNGLRPEENHALRTCTDPWDAARWILHGLHELQDAP